MPQPDEPVRVTEELPARRARPSPTPGGYVYDLGQNMVGVARLTPPGEAGQTVTIRYAEVLNPDGTLYTANLRSREGDRPLHLRRRPARSTYEPKFTFHGFRYVEITGADAPRPSSPT